MGDSTPLGQELLQRLIFPGPAHALNKALIDANLEAEPGGDGSRGLQGTSQRTRVQGTHGQAGQLVGSSLGLYEASLGQPGVTRCRLLLGMLDNKNAGSHLRTLPYGRSA